ncbi:hypothetical protein Dimus_010558 [Dionaea muscipula]
MAKPPLNGVLVQGSFYATVRNPAARGSSLPTPSNVLFHDQAVAMTSAFSSRADLESGGCFSHIRPLPSSARMEAAVEPRILPASAVTLRFQIWKNKSELVYSRAHKKKKRI